MLTELGLQRHGLGILLFRTCVPRLEPDGQLERIRRPFTIKLAAPTEAASKNDSPENERIRHDSRATRLQWIRATSF